MESSIPGSGTQTVLEQPRKAAFLLFHLSPLAVFR
jgi:hypothetical protein